MIRYFTHFILAFMMLMLSVTLYAQKDVAQFLGIPIDGYKPEMIRKLKDKGFTNSDVKKDVLVGEFNGTNVNVHIVTNNNKVCRIMVADANNISEGDIKIRFNKLCQQFQNNKNYIPLPDSTISKYIISEDDDISYELSVNNKRYEAIFYQKTADYDSLTLEMSSLFKKDTFTDADKERLSVIMAKMISLDNFNKVVWFMISEFHGKYYITMYYDNEYNRAKGEDL
ncbi:MAG: hypothetical protein V4685_12940 [Bacteroidota bacterium]